MAATVPLLLSVDGGPCRLLEFEYLASAFDEQATSPPTGSLLIATNGSARVASTPPRTPKRSLSQGGLLALLRDGRAPRRPTVDNPARISEVRCTEHSVHRTKLPERAHVARCFVSVDLPGRLDREPRRGRDPSSRVDIGAATRGELAVRPALVHDFLSTLELPDSALESLSDLEMMAEYKYDGYEMFSPGTRFLEHLYCWLKQFAVKDRGTAVEFLRRRLIFISQREMQDLARVLYYDQIVPAILAHIIEDQHLGPLDYAEAFRTHFPNYLRRCLFVGLSDGAKIDFFRRHHIDLSHEQVLPYYRSRAEEYHKDLREETQDPDAEFWALFLIDDFVGSGYTLIRERSGKIDGSLVRLNSHLKDHVHAADKVYVCHYVATAHSHVHVRQLAEKVEPYKGKLEMLSPLILGPSTVVGADTSAALDQAFLGLCDRYYSENYENVNTRKGGGIKLGFGEQALPLVLYSNTPNNSLFLLWLDRPFDQQPFRALFRRLDRHRLK